MNLSCITLAAALAVTTVLPVAAETARWIMFPSDGACYLRQYSRDHLAKHQNQLVTHISLGPEYGQTEADVLILRVAVYVRGSDEQYRGSAYCDSTGSSLSCHLEGDGGWFTLSPGKNGALAMKVGRDIDVLIDAVDDEGGASGRSKYDAPEIDGEVHLRDAGG